MKKTVLTLFFAYLTLFSSTDQACSENRTVSYRNTKTTGMGDTKIAGGFSYNGFVDNPALLTRVKHIRFSLITLPISINYHIFDISNFIYYNKYNFENFNSLKTEGKEIFLEALSDYEGEWGYINVSPMIDFSFSYHQNSIGFAVYDINEFGIRTGRVDFQPNVWGKGFNRKVYVIGYARPLDLLFPGLKIGINLKFIERRRISTFQVKMEDLGSLEEISESISDEFKIKNKTFAIDIGTLWTIPNTKSEIGVTFQSIGDGRGASFDVGMAHQLFWKKFILLADCRDILDNNKENVFKKFHFGTEIIYDVFAFRAGLNSGYYSYGFGLNFKVFHIDFAFFSDEVGPTSDRYQDERMKCQMRLGW